MFTAPMVNDVLAAVHYLKKHGAQTVFAIGGSFGGAATGDASIQSKPGEIDLGGGKYFWKKLLFTAVSPSRWICPSHHGK
jgi:acetyl esterase/lipase